MKKTTQRLCLAAALPGLLWAGLALADGGELKVTDLHFTLAKGYLSPVSLPVRLALLGAPPKPDSAAMAHRGDGPRAGLRAEPGYL